MNRRTILRHCNYIDGQLYWRNKKAGRDTTIPMGQMGTVGYTYVLWDGRKYRVHKLVWTYHNGTIPKGSRIEHIDQDKTNNCIENLRLVP